MSKRLWSAIIVCLLVQLMATGCGSSKNQSYREQSYSGQEVRDAEDSAKETEPDDNAISERESDVVDAPQPSPSPAPIASAEPTVSPNAQADPTPKPAANKASPKPEASKKPSVAVNQHQSKAKSTQSKLSLSQLVVKYPNTFKLRGSASEKKIALTFDDGPDTRFTPKVLDVLKENHVKATFFLLGSKSNEHPDVVRRIVREGHIIGNHSYSHANMPKLSVEKFQSQIEDTESILQSLSGYAPKLIRPPYGAINEDQVKWVAAHRYLIVNWNVDSLDWKSLKSDQVMQNIMRQTKPGSIILQHSGGADSQDLSGTVQALGPLIAKLRAAGYSFVTVPELLHVPKSK